MPMRPRGYNDQALKQVCVELQGLRGGVTDTSTLIYLDSLEILPFAAQWFQFALIPQVVREFGRQPMGMQLVVPAPAATVDEAVTHTAITLGLPIFSEDGRILRKARQLRHPHYNSLMLFLALHAQGLLSEVDFFRLRDRLLGFARYSNVVLAYAEQLLDLLRETPPSRSCAQPRVVTS
ncbi:MAG: hypothetical protein PHI97_08285 [Desulfobulbus sp.]|nr:hypothetical protein [Desulfobulbus sp.]